VGKQLETKGRSDHVWVAGILCDPLVTRGPYLSAEIKGCINSSVYLYLAAHKCLLILFKQEHWEKAFPPPGPNGGKMPLSCSVDV